MKPEAEKGVTPTNQELQARNGPPPNSPSLQREHRGNTLISGFRPPELWEGNFLSL